MTRVDPTVHALTLLGFCHKAGQRPVFATSDSRRRFSSDEFAADRRGGGEIVDMFPELLKGRVIDRNLMFTVLREGHGTTLHAPNNFFFQKIFRVAEYKSQFSFEFLEHGGRRTNAASRTSVAERR